VDWAPHPAEGDNLLLSGFNRAFKAAYGVSPKELRNPSQKVDR